MTDELAILLENDTKPQEDAGLRSDEDLDRMSRDLWARFTNTKGDEDRYRRAEEVDRKIAEIDIGLNHGKFAKATMLWEISRDKLYVELGFDKPIDYAMERANVSRSHGYRLMKVGAFIEEFDILSINFEEEFYREHGIMREVVRDKDGNLDRDATAAANSLATRLNFPHLTSIVAAYDKGHITAAQISELMAKSILLSNDDEFQKALKEAKGETNPMTPFEKLMDAGFDVHNLLVPVRGRMEAHDLAHELDVLASAIRGGQITESLEKLRANNVEAVANKSVRFVESDGFKFVVI